MNISPVPKAKGQKCSLVPLEPPTGLKVYLQSRLVALTWAKGPFSPGCLQAHMVDTSIRTGLADPNLFFTRTHTKPERCPNN